MLVVDLLGVEVRLFGIESFTPRIVPRIGFLALLFQVGCAINEGVVPCLESCGLLINLLGPLMNSVLGCRDGFLVLGNLRLSRLDTLVLLLDKLEVLLDLLSVLLFVLLQLFLGQPDLGLSRLLGQSHTFFVLVDLSLSLLEAIVMLLDTLGVLVELLSVGSQLLLPLLGSLLACRQSLLFCLDRLLFPGNLVFLRRQRRRIDVQLVRLEFVQGFLRLDLLVECFLPGIQRFLGLVKARPVEAELLDAVVEGGLVRAEPLLYLV